MPERGRMPVVFTGHGYPMNAITDNPARDGWRRLGGLLGKPRAILAVTSHWETSGVCVRVAEDNPQLFDVVDLPEEIYAVRCAPPADAALVERVFALLGGAAYEDNSWGVDHALWTPLSNMYPAADVPLTIVSTDVDAAPEEMVALGKKLAPLRREGVLLLASGNIVHNVDLVDHGMPGGYDWALRFDRAVRERVLAGDIGALIHYDTIEDHATAVPTVDHYWPLLFALGAAEGDAAAEFNAFVERGSLSMTSFVFG